MSDLTLNRLRRTNATIALIKRKLAAMDCYCVDHAPPPDGLCVICRIQLLEGEVGELEYNIEELEATVSELEEAIRDALTHEHDECKAILANILEED